MLDGQLATSAAVCVDREPAVIAAHVGSRLSLEDPFTMAEGENLTGIDGTVLMAVLVMVNR
jgi:hypothetical protein